MIRLKEKIKCELMKRNFLLYNRIRIVHHNIDYFMHRREASEYSKFGIFDIDKIPAKIYFHRKEIYPHNSFYGIERVIREYAGWNKRFPAYIEHGIMDIDYVEEKEYYQYNKPPYITFGEMRESVIQERLNTKTVKIGPYICYANPWYTEEQERRIKEKYGRILTVFPNHMIEGFNMNYGIEEFCKEIKQCKDKLNIDTVFLCGYWYDIVQGNLEPYKQCDFVWVSAGHAMDQNFLLRLKSIIRLSDYTMSNAFGTHVGYSLVLNKPHYIYKQPRSVIDAGGNTVEEPSYIAEESRKFDDFDKFSTLEQKKAAEYIFGISKVLSPRAMNEILDSISRENVNCSAR